MREGSRRHPCPSRVLRVVLPVFVAFGFRREGCRMCRSRRCPTRARTRARVPPLGSNATRVREGPALRGMPAAWRPDAGNVFAAKLPSLHAWTRVVNSLALIRCPALGHHVLSRVSRIRYMRLTRTLEERHREERAGSNERKATRESVPASSRVFHPLTSYALPGTTGGRIRQER